MNLYYSIAAIITVIGFCVWQAYKAEKDWKALHILFAKGNMIQPRIGSNRTYEVLDVECGYALIKATPGEIFILDLVYPAGTPQTDLLIYWKKA